MARFNMHAVFWEHIAMRCTHVLKIRLQPHLEIAPRQRRFARRGLRQDRGGGIGQPVADVVQPGKPKQVNNIFEILGQSVL